MGTLKERVSKFISFIISVGKTELVLLSLSVIFFLLSLGLFVTTHVASKTDGEVQIQHSQKNDLAILVDVGGAVERPGVYELPEGSRVKDAVVAANGISANADRQYLAQTINGARTLNDGEKIFIPEQMGAISLTATASKPVVQGVTASSVNINTATASELDELPGVGEKTAAKVINGRPYQNIIELREKKIVGQAVYEKIKDSITTY